MKEIYTVLLVDDEEDDRYFLREAVLKYPKFKIVQELTDGEQAVNYLSGADKFADRKTYPLPDLMLLDLKMPRMTGYEVLRWLQTKSFFPFMTVIVLSGSSLPEDMQASFDMGAHGYFTKTVEYQKQQLMLREIEALLEGRSGAFVRWRNDGQQDKHV